MDCTLKELDHDTAKRLSSELNIKTPLAKVLAARGFIDAESAKRFLEIDANTLCDPFLLCDMDRAVERIESARLKSERVMIYGDYDADGITATASMYIFLTEIGIETEYYIPDRFGEGYGMNVDAVTKAKDRAVSLIITVDNGISAAPEIKIATDMGIDVIVTDHHDCPPEFPQAYAVVNPKRSDNGGGLFRELAGAGVAVKVITAYYTRFAPDKLESVGRFYEFTAIGTIADMMPLLGDNRIYASIGLERMPKSANFGIQALLESYYRGKRNGNRNVKAKLASEAVSFFIAPRINAAGRLASANRSLELFLAPDYDTALGIANELEEYNKNRQTYEREIFREACHEADNREGGIPPISVLHADNWNQGVIGIVASKLLEKYGGAFILLTRDSEDIYKGSCRSLTGIHITEALTAVSDILIKFGGHEKAAGLSIKRENIPLLQERLNQYAVEHELKIVKNVKTNIDCELEQYEISLESVAELTKLEPCGLGNPTPLFIIRRCYVQSLSEMGEGKHLKLELVSDGRTAEAVFFGKNIASCGFEAFADLDLAAELSINDFKNNRRVQYILRDAVLSVDSNAAKIPERADFTRVYRLLNIGAVLPLDITKAAAQCGLLPEAFILILDIFVEMKLIHAEYDGDNIYKLLFTNTDGKVDLDRSLILQKLKARKR
ncbi:hypothetical protein FACS1894219_07430 [Clostridia bacterium]|nr:hypothetical protein FACS1894219_07430 [Clostridia bacterium]